MCGVWSVSVGAAPCLFVFCTEVAVRFSQVVTPPAPSWTHAEYTPEHRAMVNDYRGSSITTAGWLAQMHQLGELGLQVEAQACVGAHQHQQDLLLQDDRGIKQHPPLATPATLAIGNSPPGGYPKRLLGWLCLPLILDHSSLASKEKCVYSLRLGRAHVSN